MKENKLFMDMKRKIIKQFDEKSLSVFGGAPLSASKHTKTLS